MPHAARRNVKWSQYDGPDEKKENYFNAMLGEARSKTKDQKQVSMQRKTIAMQNLLCKLQNKEEKDTCPQK